MTPEGWTASLATKLERARQLHHTVTSEFEHTSSNINIGLSSNPPSHISKKLIMPEDPDESGYKGSSAPLSLSSAVQLARDQDDEPPHCFDHPVQTRKHRHPLIYASVSLGRWCDRAYVLCPRSRSLVLSHAPWTRSCWSAVELNRSNRLDRLMSFDTFINTDLCQ